MKKSASALVALAMAVAASTTAWAGFEEGMEALKEGLLASARDQFLPLAVQGHTESQFQLGQVFYMEQNFENATRWFKDAVESGGHAAAQYRLGQMQYFGHGVKRSPTQAAALFLKAAEGGEPGAQYDIGVMYMTGEGVEKNLIQAYLWFSKAAEKGYPAAKKRRDQASARLTPQALAAAKRVGKGDPRASFRSGQEYMALNQAQKGYFIQGMADMLWETQQYLPEDKRFAWTRSCLRTSTASQMVIMLTDHLSQRPEEQRYAAAETFLKVMQETCEGFSQPADDNS